MADVSGSTPTWCVNDLAQSGEAVAGFAGVIRGAEMVDRVYHVLCVKK